MACAVSVVTPSFNQGRFVERTVLSVLSQHAPALEYVIMDGGSSDETVAILRRFETDLRWTSEPDNGQADAVNKGITCTTGDIIGWLNSDDTYYPGAIETVYKFLEDHPEVDVVYGDATHIDVDDRIIEPYYTEPWDDQRLQDLCFLCQPAVFFRRRVVKRFGLLDVRLKYCMDYEYWLRLAGGGTRFAYLKKLLAGSRMYPTNKTLGARVAAHRETNDMFKRLQGRVPDRWLFNYAHVFLEQRGLRRSSPLAFAIAVSLASVGASLYWNHSLSANLTRTVSGWIRGNVKSALRRIGSQ